MAQNMNFVNVHTSGVSENNYNAYHVSVKSGDTYGDAGWLFNRHWEEATIRAFLAEYYRGQEIEVEPITWAEAKEVQEGYWANLEEYRGSQYKEGYALGMEELYNMETDEPQFSGRQAWVPAYIPKDLCDIVEEFKEVFRGKNSKLRRRLARLINLAYSEGISDAQGYGGEDKIKKAIEALGEPYIRIC